jgi:hypothetical protein
MKKYCSYSSIIVGIIGILVVLSCWYVFDFFTSNGKIASVGLIIEYSTLVLSGILLTMDSKYSKISYLVFGYLTIVERIIIMIVFYNYLLIFVEIFIPIIIAIIYLIIQAILFGKKIN